MAVPRAERPARRRVVVTGVGLASPIGHSLDAVTTALRSGAHGLVAMPEWDRIGELTTRVAGRVQDLSLKGRWPRQNTRSMGRVALLSAYATDRAIEDAALSGELLRSGRLGMAHGSTHGSSDALEKFCRRAFDKDSLQGIGSSEFLRFMSNTTAANLAILYGIKGRVLSTCAACVSGSQAVGAGLEAIRAGAQDVMLCGGAEELHWVPAGVFDIFQATSTRFNETPDRASRPFDDQRDGLVIAEGACTVVLEALEHAEARGAQILGEVLGYGTNCDGAHVTAPSREGMQGAMALALDDAGVSASEIDYVNAHATGTQVGDIEESFATRAVVGESTPVSSTKGHTGHTLGACGTLELVFAIAMMKAGFVPGTRNLERIDPECAPLDYVLGDARPMQPNLIMSNNFAFGGVNTSLIVARPT